VRQIDPVAYDHYLRGRDLFRARGEPKLVSAESELESAIRLAPDFAPAWATRAGVRYILADHREDAPRNYQQLLEESVSDAQRALELDKDNVEGIGVSAITMPTSGRHDEIEKLFERALAVEPNNSQVLNWYSSFLGSVGRVDDARNARSHAYLLDPLTSAIAANYVSQLVHGNRIGDAQAIIASKSHNWPWPMRLHAQLDLLTFTKDWAGVLQLLDDPRSQTWLGSDFHSAARKSVLALTSQDPKQVESALMAWKENFSSRFLAERVNFVLLLGDLETALAIVEAHFLPPASGQRLDEPFYGSLFREEFAPLRRDRRFLNVVTHWGLLDYWRQSGKWPDFCSDPQLTYDCRAEADRLIAARDKATDQ
jgi:hypothetical protein